MGIMIRGYDQNSQSRDIDVRTMTTGDSAFFTYVHGRYMLSPGTLNDGDDTYLTFDNARRLRVMAKIDTPINLSTGDVTVDAFILSDATTHADATAFIDSESLTGKTIYYLGVGGYDKTGDKFYAFPFNVNDAAYGSTNLNIPVGGKYIASLPTYTDGDAVPFSFTVNGKLLTDLSSVAGTATVTAGVNGLLAIGGNVAHDDVDTGYPIKMGGKASTTKPSAVANGDRVNAYLDEYGRPHVFNESGTTVLPANYVSPTDGTAVFTSNVTITCSGFPFTVDDANCTISYVQYKPTGGVWQFPFSNGVNGVSISASANVITVAGAGTPFVSGDTYRVGIRYQDKSYVVATNSTRTTEVNPLNTQVLEESLVDTTNVAASQQWYPSSAGMAMLGYKNLSLTGKYIEGDAVTSTITVWAMNDEDTTNGDWIQIYGYDSKNNTFVNSLSQVNAGTLTFAWDFDNLNYKYVRVGLLPGDATNTAIIKSRRTAL